MFGSGRKLSNLLHQSVTLSHLLLILHNCVPDFHAHQWIPAYSTSKCNGNLQVQRIPTQTAVTRQEHAIMWSAGMKWKPRLQQECYLLFLVRKCCSSAGGAAIGSCWGHLASNISFLLLCLQPWWPAQIQGFSEGFCLQSNDHSALVLQLMYSSGLTTCRTKDLFLFILVFFKVR